jgi:hypothetical protein
VAKEAATGRVYIFLAKDSAREPRLLGGSYGGSVPFFGVDVSAMSPGAVATVDQSALGYPYESLSKVPAGQYYVQALMNVYTKFNRADGHVIWAHNDQWEGQHFNTSPGNLVSGVQRVTVDPKSPTPIRLTLTKVLPKVEVPPDTRWVKHPHQERAPLEVLGPTDVHRRHRAPAQGIRRRTSRRYPAIYSQGHFGLGPRSGLRTSKPTARRSAAAVPRRRARSETSPRPPASRATSSHSTG